MTGNSSNTVEESLSSSMATTATITSPQTFEQTLRQQDADNLMDSITMQAPICNNQQVSKVLFVAPLIQL